MSINLKRVRKLNKIDYNTGPVIYWMQRDQRTIDNWALLYAQQLAFQHNVPLMVVFCLVPNFLDANIRHYSFMLKGLKEVEKQLKIKRIPFYLLLGQPDEELLRFVEEKKGGTVVSDFNPLNIVKNWKNKLSTNLKIPFFEVDSHNIIPCWLTSPKQEYGAYTIRPKINRQLYEFLENIPSLKDDSGEGLLDETIDWDAVLRSLKVDHTIPEVDWIQPGESEALASLSEFINSKLETYSRDRNDPNKDVLSNMSPYLHFGHISAQRIAFEVKKTSANQDSKDSYLEELIVRRELSDNFCFYNKDYQTLSSLPGWAKNTLDIHKHDIRTHIYSLEELEQALTHDKLWNAAQLQMLVTGKMHSYMRMYWAKKILEWTQPPDQSLKYAIYLNDKYELDGRDPNGYTGILWSIGGLHDRAWKERPVFGKIRYMSYNGCKNKFNINHYIDKFNNHNL